MNKIVTDERDWQSIDKLDDVALVEGELIEIQMPDGVIEQHKVKTQVRREPGADVGHDGDVPVSHAFIEIRYHQAYAWIRIAGFLAKRVA